MSLTQITMAREDITDRHVQSAFSAIVGGFTVIGGFVYLSLYLPVFWRCMAFAVAIPLLVWAVRRWAENENKPPRRVLMMLSNHETGYDADEARLAADTFEDWNILPVWCSLQGGAAPGAKGMHGVEGDDETLPLARCPAADFVALYLVGGPGAAFEWGKSAPLHARVAEVLQQGGTVGACGTGISGLSEAIDLVKNENILYITGAKATKELKAMDTSKRPLIVGKLGESARLVATAMAAGAPSEAPSQRLPPPSDDKKSK
jgi:putative intracellular protease/amidase